MIERSYEIDVALEQNLTSLKEGLLDLLASLILCMIALCSVVHAVFRLVFAFLGLLLWSLALVVTFLYWLRSWAVSRSSSSLHTGR